MHKIGSANFTTLKSQVRKTRKLNCRQSTSLLNLVCADETIFASHLSGLHQAFKIAVNIFGKHNEREGYGALPWDPQIPLPPPAPHTCCLSASTTRQIIQRLASSLCSRYRGKTARSSLSRIWTMKCDKNWSLKNWKNVSNTKWKCGHRGVLTREKTQWADTTGEGNPGVSKAASCCWGWTAPACGGRRGPTGWTRSQGQRQRPTGCNPMDNCRPGPQHCQEPPSQEGSGSSAHPSCIPGFLRHSYHTACVPTNRAPSQAHWNGSLLCTTCSQTSTQNPQTGNQPFDKPFT